jgi:hypothetical protein
MTNETDITPFVADQIDELYTNFNYNVVPSLMKLLDAFSKFEESVPSEIRDCINAASSRLNDEASVLRNTLELC